MYDIVETKLMARVKQIAVNLGLVAQLPWEAALFKPGELEGVRSACQLPPELLVDVKNGRDAAKRMTYSSAEITLTDLKKLVCGPKPTTQLLALDRSFSLDVLFLQVWAVDMCTSKVHTAVLKCLPSAEATKSYAQVLPR